jgi:TPR repeat protein
MRSLAHALAVGISDEIDPRQALRWYEAAARAGDGEAQYQVGMMYLQGLGVERDPERAKTWLLAARRNQIGMADAGLQALATLAR